MARSQKEQISSLIKGYNYFILGPLSTLLVIIPLAAIVVTVLVGNLIYDDYSALYFYRDEVWLQNASSELLQTGRVGQSVLSSTLYGGLGTLVIFIIPIISNIGLYLVLYLYLSRIFKYFEFKLLKYKIFIISLLIYLLIVTSNSAPVFVNVSEIFPIFPSNGVWFSFENFFWAAGAITYTIPLVLFLLGTYLITFKMNTLRKSIRLSLLFVFSTMCFTTNEILPSSIAFLSFVIFICSFFPYFPKSFVYFRQYLLVFFTAGVIAFIALVTSAGSTQRQQAAGVTDRLSYTLDSLTELLTGVSEVFSNFLVASSSSIVDILVLVAYSFWAAKLAFDKKLSEDKNKQIPKTLFLYGIFLLIFGGASAFLTISLVSVGYGSPEILTRTMIIPQILFNIGKFASLTAVFLLLFSLQVKWLTASLSILATSSVLFALPIVAFNSRVQISNVSSYSALWSSLERQVTSVIPEGDGTLYFQQSNSQLLGKIPEKQDLPIPNCQPWYYVSIANYFGINKFCTIHSP